MEDEKVLSTLNHTKPRAWVLTVVTQPTQTSKFKDLG